jgi:hypothetical protein
MQQLFNWILTFMLSFSPPGVILEKEQGESPDQTVERYNKITEDLIEVVFSKENKPLFSEPDGRSHTAAVMLGIMAHESRFLHHIDMGLVNGRGDSGHSWCMMQIMTGPFGATSTWNFIDDHPPYWGDPQENLRKGVTGKQLVENRQLCFSEGLRYTRWSFSRCGNRGPLEKLRVYASGDCSKGGSASRTRLGTAETFWTSTKDQRTWSDEEIVKLVEDSKNDKAWKLSVFNTLGKAKFELTSF